MSQESKDGSGLNILCLDGGGVRALSSLLLVSELMTRVQDLEGLDAPPDPYQYFDVIAGTGTGGVIACMLGRLHMSISQAIRSYSELVKEVFSERKLTGTGAFKSTQVKNAIREIIHEAIGEENESMVENNDENDRCKTMVFAMSKHNMGARAPTISRSNRGRANQAPECTIWEALCATMAHLDPFKGVEIGRQVKELFVDGSLGCSNPLAHVLTEVKAMYPGRHVGSIVSIGAGHTGTIQIKSNGLQQFLPTNASVAMKGIAEDSEKVAEDMDMRFEGTKGVYYRFNVDQAMQNVETNDWERLDDVATHTRAYIQQASITQRMDESARAVKTRRRRITTEQIDGRIQPNSSEPQFVVKRCPAPTPVFTGREKKMQQVKKCIGGGHNERRVCVVHGLGGAGKTQLVLKVIERTREQWSVVLYLDASSREAIETTLQAFGVANQIGKTHEDTIMWLESRREQWLLVFDNADSPWLNLRDFIPNCHHGSIIITTRLYDMRLLAQGPGGDCNVSSMDPEDALALLMQVARIQDDKPASIAMSAATALLEELGYLALAIVHAGAYICQSGMGIAKYQDLFLTRRQTMLDEYQKLLVKVDEYEKSVYTTWTMCYELLGPTAQSLLWLMAFLHFDGITEAIFERAAMNMTRKMEVQPSELEASALSSLRKLLVGFLDPERRWDSLLFMQAMNEILSYSLIEVDRANQSYRINVLVQDWAQTVIPHSKKLAIECTTALLFLSMDLETSSEAYAFRKGLELHINRLLLERGDMPNAHYASRFAEVYYEGGHWKKSEELWGAALDAYKRLLGDEHPGTLTAMQNLASTYGHQGRQDEAERLLVQVLDSKKRILGAEHPDTLTAMNNLASTYSHQSRRDEAERLQVQVLDARKRILGDEHPDTLTAMNNLASTYSDQGRQVEAEKLQVQVLDASKRVLGDAHPDTLTAMNNLASPYSDQGRLEEAEKLQVQVLDASKQVLGDEHPETLTAMNNLASTYSDQGRLDEAERLQVKVLDACKRVLGFEHRDTLAAMGNLALTYRDQGRREEAERLQVQVLDASKRVLGYEHPDTMAAVSNLALTYRDLGRGEAERLQVQVQVLYASKRLLGDEHPDTLTAMHSLASTYGDQGRLGEAERLQASVLDARKRLLGDAHPGALTAMHNLASTYSHQGRQDEAERLLVQVLNARKRLLGAEHPDTLTTMNSLAFTYSHQGRRAEAERQQVQVLNASKRVLGAEHPDTLIAMNNLASTYRDQGRRDEAEKLQVQVLDACKRVLGDEHPDTLTAMNNLASTYGEQGRQDEAMSLQAQVLDARKRLLGEQHPDTLTAMNNLASTLSDQGRGDEAERLQVQVLDARKRVLGLEHRDTLAAMGNLALTYGDQGRRDEAERIQVQVMDASKRALGYEHPDTLAAMYNLALTYSDQGRRNEAEELLVQVLSARKRVLGYEHPETLTTMNILAMTYLSQCRWEDAEKLMMTLVALSKKTLGENHASTLQHEQRLSEIKSARQPIAQWWQLSGYLRR